MIIVRIIVVIIEVIIVIKIPIAIVIVIVIVIIHHIASYVGAPACVIVLCHSSSMILVDIVIMLFV